MKINPLSSNDINLIKRALKYMEPYRLKFAAAFVCILSGIGFGIIQPLLWGRIVSSLFEKALDKSLMSIVCLLVLYVVQALLDFCQSYLFTYLNQNIIFDIKKGMYKKMLDLRVKAFDEINNGEFMSRLHGDAAAVSNILTNQVLNTIVDILRAVVVGFTVFTISLPLGVIVILSFPFTYLIFLKFGSSIRSTNNETAKLNDRYFSSIAESIWGIREVKTLGIKDIKFQSFLSLSRELREKTIKISILNTLSQTLSQGVNYISQVGIMAVGGFLVVLSKLTMQHFIAFSSYSAQFSGSLINITRINSSIQQILTSLERIFGVMDGLSYGTESFGSRTLEKINGKISFENISFSYTEKDPVLEYISFEIRQNSKTAFVGNSGSGKSTIFSLILKFYEADRGRILIDDTDIRDFDETSLRKHICVVRQDPFLFRASIRDNLLLADPGASQYEIEEACRKAYIHQYIAGLPDSYDSIIGENGVTLSGGEKQRIAIARALLKKSKIVLFDEATSSLDNESQFFIKRSIDLISQDHTVVIIAHRLSTIIEADRIYVVDKGRISGCGSHGSLIRNNPIYRLLYETELKVLKEKTEEVV